MRAFGARWIIALIVLPLLPVLLAADSPPAPPGGSIKPAPADRSRWSGPVRSRPVFSPEPRPSDASLRREVLRLVRQSRRPGTSDSTRYELARALAGTETIEGRRRALELLGRVRHTYWNDKGFHWQRARIYETSRQTSQVRGALREILRIDPREVEAWVELARLRLDEVLHEFDPARAARMFEPLDQALAIDPDHRDALFLRSLGLELLASNPDQAIPYLSRDGVRYARRILDRHPADAAARLLLAVHLLDLDERDAAAAQFDSALAAAPPPLRQAFMDSCWTSTPADTEDVPIPPPDIRDSANHRYWVSQDPTPLSLINEGQLEIWKRMALADILFGRPDRDVRGWETGPGEALVRYGKPNVRTYEPASAFPSTSLDQVPPFGATIEDDQSGWGYINRVFKPPTWRWLYRFQGLEFSLGFQDDCLNDRYAFDDGSRWKLATLRERTPVVFDQAPPGEIRHVFLASAGTARDGGRWVHQTFDVGVPFWRPDPRRLWLDKVRLDLVVRDSTRAIVRQVRHEAEPGDVAALRLDRRLDWLHWRDSFDLPPGRYTVTAFVEDGDSHVQGSFSRPVDVRDYAAEPALTVSDLELAFAADDSTKGRTAERAGQRYLPDPLGFAGQDRRLEIYYDLYGLGELFGRSRHQVRFTIMPRASVLEFEVMVQDGRVRPDDLVSFAARQAATGTALDERNYFDVFFPPVTMRVETSRANKATRLTLPDLVPGEYALVLSVTDQLTRDTAHGTTYFRVLSPEQRAGLTSPSRPGARRAD